MAVPFGVAAALAVTGAAALAPPAAFAGVPARTTPGAVPDVPPVHGYDAHWLFNANDGEPTAHVTVARNGTFSFSYRPSYCGTGQFLLRGAFRDVRGSYFGTPGYVVTIAVSGSCDGKGQSAGNFFTWSGIHAVSILDKWPDSRAVQGTIVQTAVDGTARGNLDIDLDMAAN